MKIIDKAITPDGIEIQLEDWSSKNSVKYPDLYGLMIAAYPIAKNTGYWIRGGEKFRLSIHKNSYANYTNDDVKNDYEALKNGSKKLKNLSERFRNGEKDKYYLGMENNYKEG